MGERIYIEYKRRYVSPEWNLLQSTKDDLHKLMKGTSGFTHI